MNAVAIQSIWQAIQESERSDDLSFIDALTRLTQPQPDRSSAPGAANRAPDLSFQRALGGNPKASQTGCPTEAFGHDGA